MNKSKLYMIASFIGIPVVPYVFILLMGLLEKSGIITTRYSQLIVIVAIILLIGMSVVAHKNYRNYKDEKPIQDQNDQVE